MLHNAFDRKWPGEQGGGRGAVAILQRSADTARRYHAAIIDHGPHGGGCQAMRAAQVAQHINIAAALMPKGKILTRDHGRNAQTFHQQCDDKIFGAGRRKLCIEIKHQHCVGTGFCKKALALIEGGQTEPRRFWRKKAHGMRIKCCDNRWLTCRLGLFYRFARNGLMPQMKAIKIAQGNDTAAQCVRHLVFGRKAGNGHCAVATFSIGTKPARITRNAFSPMTARISSGVKPSSINAWVTCASCEVSKRTVVAPS